VKDETVGSIPTKEGVSYNDWVDTQMSVAGELHASNAADQAQEGAGVVPGKKVEGGNGLGFNVETNGAITTKTAEGVQSPHPEGEMAGGGRR
jgi:hypothetical protein